MPSGLRETLYLSQVQQAWAIRTAVDYWRSLRPRCMGTLYWQLNDVWPASSWSSLDYDGNWKLLHYEARRFFEPLHLALISDAAGATPEAGVRAVAVNDGLDRYVGRLSLRLRRLDGTIAFERLIDVAVPPEASVELASIEATDLPCSPEEAFVEAVLALRAPDGRSETRTAVSFLAPPKRCSLPDPRLEAIVVDGAAGGGGPELLLRCERPAFFVSPEAAGGQFEDSGFHLMPGEERRLRFIPHHYTGGHGGAEELDAEALRASLRVLQLRASYEYGAS